MSSLVGARTSVMLVILVLVSLSLPPITQAVTCTISIDNLQYPAVVESGWTFMVQAVVTVTCQQAGDRLSGYAYLTDLSSNTILDAQTFILGFIPVQTPSSLTSSLRLTVPTTPSINAPWPLRITVEAHGMRGTFASVQQDFSIQVEQRNEATLTLSILQNGGFEQGMSAWQLIGRQGHTGISTKQVHSGSSSLYASTIPPLMGTNPVNLDLQGASQTVTVANLRDLQARVWYSFGTFANTPSAQVTVEVGSLKIDYPYLNCGYNMMWCLFQRDVGQDLKTQDRSQAQTIFAGQQAIPVTISLKIIPGPASTYIFWDDVEIDALTATQTTSTTLTTTSESTTQTIPDQSSTTIQLSSSTVQTSQLTLPSSLTLNQAWLLGGMIVSAVVLIALALIVKNRIASHQFCVSCGAKITSHSKFCNNCGRKQEGNG